jgi:hypothetical protein
MNLEDIQEDAVKRFTVLFPITGSKIDEFYHGNLKVLAKIAAEIAREELLKEWREWLTLLVSANAADFDNTLKAIRERLNENVRIANSTASTGPSSGGADAKKTNDLPALPQTDAQG